MSSGFVVIVVMGFFSSPVTVAEVLEVFVPVLAVSLLVPLSTVPFIYEIAEVDDRGIRARNYVRRIDVPWSQVTALSTIVRKTPWYVRDYDEYEYLQIHLADGKIFEPKALCRRSTVSKADVDTMVRLARRYGLGPDVVPDSLSAPFPKTPGYMAQLGIDS
jgi:hypothetical protein